MTDDTHLARWLALWERLDAKGDGEALHADLVARYAEPQRAYHTLPHIAHCLEQFDGARELAVYPDEVELAIWFHDAVYDPRVTDNEAQSAALAHRTALDADIRRASAKRVYHLILATQHKALPTDPDQQLLVDVDLSSLGGSWDTFDRNGRNIRREFAHVADAAYREGRAAFFEAFLARPSIYSTPSFRERYEAAARANLARALADFRAGSPC